MSALEEAHWEACFRRAIQSAVAAESVLLAEYSDILSSADAVDCSLLEKLISAAVRVETVVAGVLALVPAEMRARFEEDLISAAGLTAHRDTNQRRNIDWRLEAVPHFVRQFMESVRRENFPRAVVQQMENSDFGHPRDEYLFPNLLPYIMPDPGEQYRILTLELGDPDSHWRSLAVKWLPEYAPSAEIAIAILRTVLDDPAPEPRWWAAIHLSKAAPRTPGLDRTLQEAARADWLAYSGKMFNLVCTGADEAAEALVRLRR